MKCTKCEKGAECPKCFRCKFDNTSTIDEAICGICSDENKPCMFEAIK